MGQGERNPEAGIGQALLLQLENWLDAYDRIFLIPGEDGKIEAFASGLLHAGAGKAGEHKVLVLSAAPIEACAGFTYKQIAGKEQEQLLQLYHMYEFSDRFSVISAESTYGSLFNLVEAGLLAMEEAAEALFVYG